MKSKHLAIFTLLVLISYFLLAKTMHYPGYMDADYHFYMGQRLAEGFGFSEDILWNYLDNPQSIPHPSHSYWTPLPSIIAAAGIALFPKLATFTAAQIPFIILAATVPALVAKLAFAMSDNARIARIAGLFSWAAPYYLPFLLTTETFSPTLFLGILIFSQLKNIFNNDYSNVSIFYLGLMLGLLFLTRSEGLIWLILSAIFLMRLNKVNKLSFSPTLLGGFLLPVFPWLIRNQLSFGFPLAPGASKVLWLQNYDEFFSYPSNQLTFSHFIDLSFGEIANNWFWALGQNGMSAIGVVGAVVLIPFALIYIRKNWNANIVRFAVVGFGAILALMSIVFPFAGVRGGFFHSVTFLQPIFWVIAALGFGEVISWGIKNRSWQGHQATLILGSGLTLIIMALSSFIFTQRVIGIEPGSNPWNASGENYEIIAQRLNDIVGESQITVLVNNPPGFSNVSEHSSIVIPYGNEAITLQVAEKFDAQFLILEPNHPEGLASLYADPNSAQYFHYLFTQNESHIFSLLK
jgi:hypothetical protein